MPCCEKRVCTRGLAGAVRPPCAAHRVSHCGGPDGTASARCVRSMCLVLRWDGCHVKHTGVPSLSTPSVDVGVWTTRGDAASDADFGPTSLRRGTQHSQRWASCIAAALPRSLPTCAVAEFRPLRNSSRLFSPSLRGAECDRERRLFAAHSAGSPTERRPCPL